MAILRVEIEQFAWNGNVLVHRPTGAVFSWQNEGMRTGEVSTDWKRAADLLSNGDEFDPDEIDIVARKIMNEYEGV
jgi:hypothetical protein